MKRVLVQLRFVVPEIPANNDGIFNLHKSSLQRACIAFLKSWCHGTIKDLKDERKNRKQFAGRLHGTRWISLYRRVVSSLLFVRDTSFQVWLDSVWTLQKRNLRMFYLKW